MVGLVVVGPMHPNQLRAMHRFPSVVEVGSTREHPQHLASRRRETSLHDIPEGHTWAELVLDNLAVHWCLHQLLSLASASQAFPCGLALLF